MGACSRALVGLTCFLQLGCAVAIIVITAMKLHNVKLGWDGATWNANVNNVCLLGSMDNGANLCYLAYMAGGISVVATGILSLLQCCTCHLCGLGSLLDAIFAAAGTFLWAVTGVIFDQYGKRPAMQNVPEPQWRFAIPVLAFAACAVFGLMALAAIYTLISAVCCMGGCCSGGSQTRTKVVYRDVEAGKMQQHGQFMVR